MDNLGTLEELPAEYVQALSEENLVPLWPSLGAVLPADIPARNTQPTHWSYNKIRPLLLRAGELTPIEKAERRVLVMSNPGHGLDAMKVSPSMYVGMQLLLPGEWAPSHRHTPNAVRMIIEGDGAYTTVAGEKCPMNRGDLILTPSGLWHEHSHDGQNPVVWLDVLDLPLIYFMETSYHNVGTRQTVNPTKGHGIYANGGVLPAPVFTRHHNPYPMLRYPWSQVRASLIALSEAHPNEKSVQVEYINPETGDSAQNILGFYALMIQPGQTLDLPARSPASLFHAIEGKTKAEISGKTFELNEADTCCAPGYTPVHLHNQDTIRPAFIFIADESPLHRKMGVLETR